MNKNLRTPIIKPRKQGGTFYTFGSAMEDIGLNINDLSNKVELSHYVLLNIPKFSDSSVFGIHTFSNASTFADSSYPGDYIFAEAFQDYVLNKETAIQNSSDYDFSKSRTVSEEVFWSWVFKDTSLGTGFNYDKGYYTEKDSSIVLGFGRISASSQRTDDYGIYNETFVQIPSSYGRMKILFKNNTTDPNFLLGYDYVGHNEDFIENIGTDEYDASTFKLNATGIDARAIWDSSTNLGHNYISDKALTVELDIEKLQAYYDDGTLTYDEIGMDKNGTINGFDLRDYVFNAMLVYYSIYTADGSNRLATNAYGVYILDNSLEDESGYRFPTLSKKASTLIDDGTSFTFRLNIKPTSAYSGDITVDDNSTSAFESSVDFDDVLRNLSNATRIMKSNSVYIKELVDQNRHLNNMLIQMKKEHDELEEKVSVLNITVNEIKSILQL